MQLKKGSLLQGGKYRIEKVLGQGGFGITYLAEQPMLERKVCIKEFFFKDYCERDESTSHVTLSTKSNLELVDRFRKKFLKEARVISKLHHDYIVQIHDIFEENQTAYYVMDYVEGESLGDMIKRVGFLPEQLALAYIKDVASALAYIHSKSINHLDIKPANIMRRKSDEHIFVIDFGVSKQYDEATFEGTTTTPVGISHGYSPAEQYRKNGVQSFSPQSDVYALAATLYKLLTGITPPEAMDVLDNGLPKEKLQATSVSSSTIQAIENAMRSNSTRTQSIEEFLADIDCLSNIKDEEVTLLTPQILHSKDKCDRPQSQTVNRNFQSQPVTEEQFWKKQSNTATNSANTSLLNRVQRTFQRPNVQIGVMIVCFIFALLSSFNEFFYWDDTSICFATINITDVIMTPTLPILVMFSALQIKSKIHWLPILAYFVISLVLYSYLIVSGFPSFVLNFKALIFHVIWGWDYYIILFALQFLLLLIINLMILATIKKRSLSIGMTVISSKTLFLSIMILYESITSIDRNEEYWDNVVTNFIIVIYIISFFPIFLHIYKNRITNDTHIVVQN